mgnify:CR=1 FL=1
MPEDADIRQPGFHDHSRAPGPGHHPCPAARSAAINESARSSFAIGTRPQNQAGRQPKEIEHHDREQVGEPQPGAIAHQAQDDAPGKHRPKFVKSPASLPGIGINLAVSGLFKREESAAISSSKASICSQDVDPGIGMVSKPVPQTAAYISKSLMARVSSMDL